MDVRLTLSPLHVVSFMLSSLMEYQVPLFSNESSGEPKRVDTTSAIDDSEVPCSKDFHNQGLRPYGQPFLEPLRII